MFVFLMGDLNVLWNTQFIDLKSFSKFYDFSFNILYLFDVLFASVGYIFTLRFIDTHIRTAEPTIWGWVCCLLCYQPFWSLIEAHYIKYEVDNYYWGNLTSGTIFYYVWGVAILALILVFVWSTVSFGLRFSKPVQLATMRLFPNKNPETNLVCLIVLVTIPL